jgi:hypothetical protein
LAYTSQHSVSPRIFPATPPRTWVVFLPEGGDRARLWSVLVNHGETANDGVHRTFEISPSEQPQSALDDSVSNGALSGDSLNEPRVRDSGRNAQQGRGAYVGNDTRIPGQVPCGRR